MGTSIERTARVRKTATDNVCIVELGAFKFERGGRVQAVLGSPEATALLEDGTSIPAFRVHSLDHAYGIREYVSLETNDVITDYFNVEMTVRREKRGNTIHWYAYRRVFGKLYKKYVGRSDAITCQRLLEVAKSLPTTK
jgi:hypothetical protein